jgi:CheY-like chemotaxis protein
MEAVGQLAGGIAHDFNNLLTAILGNAEYLAHRMGPESPIAAELGDIQKAGEQAANLTRQLLTFSRKRLLEAVPIDLARLIDDLLPMLRRVIGEQVEIVHVHAADRATVLGDRGQIEQIVINLAVNARDAMPNGGLLTLRTAETEVAGGSAAGDLPPGPYVVLEVIDTGTGMDADTKARIFEPFFTTKEFGSGTGLGLATVYGIVKQMAGAIGVESEPGRGATFRLLFPATARREVSTRAPALPDVQGGTETILVVEDDDAVRSFVTSTLKRYGYKVLTASHPAPALAIAQGHPDPIHLLITDVVMPSTSGPELARSVEACRPGTPALFISGYADAVLARLATIPKASQFLQKPFTAADLLTRVRQIMQS